jgi:hypothetical protein
MMPEEILWIIGGSLAIVLFCALIWSFYNKSKYSCLKIEDSLKIDSNNTVVLLKFEHSEFLILVGKNSSILLKEKAARESMSNIKKSFNKEDQDVSFEKIDFLQKKI